MKPLLDSGCPAESKLLIDTKQIDNITIQLENKFLFNVLPQVMINSVKEQISKINTSISDVSVDKISVSSDSIFGNTSLWDGKELRDPKSKRLQKIRKEQKKASTVENNSTLNDSFNFQFSHENIFSEF
jgi:hypothetical protein